MKRPIKPGGDTMKAVATAAADSKKWNTMGGGEKAAFVGKLMIFLISFGFAFPTLLND
jgi:hypothetical protein